MSEKPRTQPVADGNLSSDGQAALSPLESAYGFSGESQRRESSAVGADSQSRDESQRTHQRSEYSDDEKAALAQAKEYRKRFDSMSNSEIAGEVDDLLDGKLVVDRGDRVRYSAGTKIGVQDGDTGKVINAGGKYATKSQLKDIAAFADQIRDGMAGRGTPDGTTHERPRVDPVPQNPITMEADDHAELTEIMGRVNAGNGTQEDFARLGELTTKYSPNSSAASGSPEITMEQDDYADLVEVMQRFNGGQQTPEDRARLEELLAKYPQAQNGNLQPATPEQAAASQTPEQIALAARNEKLDRISAEVDQTVVGQRYRNALGDYAARKADAETKGDDQEAGWKIWQRGRQKRKVALEKAESALFVAYAEYAKKLHEKREEAGIYEGVDDGAKQVVVENDKTHDHYLLDVAMSNTTRAKRLERMERPSFGKGVAAVTKFMSGGNKKEWLLYGGAGVLTGGTVAALSGVFGVFGFPITAAIGVGARKLVRDGVERNVLDEQLKAREDAVVSDDGFDAYRLRMAGIRAETQYQKIVDEARAAGREDLIKAREVAKGKVKKFTIGYAAAGVAVHGVQLGGKLVEHFSGGSEDTAIATSGGHGPGYNFSDGAEYGNTPAPEVPSVSHGFEFPSGSDVITPGEGMDHQLGDMGFSPAEAQQLFNNHDMMMQLKGVNAVYPDSSASIGGWGINMPANGRWSPEAMSIIKNTAINMGIRS